MKTSIYLLLLLFVFSVGCSKETDNHERVCIINNAIFNISSDKSNARSTTNGINAAIEKARSEGYKTIKFAPGEYLITCMGDHLTYPTDGIFLYSNLTFDLTDAKFYVEPNNSASYSVFQLERLENVTIIGGEIIGDKEKHIYPQNKTELINHQWGSVFQIMSCENILIKGVKMKSVTGEAIMIHAYSYMHLHQMYPTDNIRITDCEFDDCGKQGVAIRHAVNVEIDNNKFRNFSNNLGVNNTWSICGIRSERYNPNDRLTQFMKIHNNYFENCGSAVAIYNGDDCEIYDNHSEGCTMTVSISRRVKVLRNIVTTPGYIHAGKNDGNTFNEDICIPTEGSNKNICDNIKNLTVLSSGNFPCN